LFSDVHIEERSVVHTSVVLPGVSVGRDCVIQRAILDEGCMVPDGTRIGVDLAADSSRFEVTESGVVLVTPEMLRAPG
jgi:glucose-1-phosphate adenylyltransferase